MFLAVDAASPVMDNSLTLIPYDGVSHAWLVLEDVGGMEMLVDEGAWRGHFRSMSCMSCVIVSLLQHLTVAHISRGTETETSVNFCVDPDLGRF